MAMTIITNIKCLAGIRTGNKLLRGKELAELPAIYDAYLLIKDGYIAAYGKMDSLDDPGTIAETNIDASGQFVLPSWCDSHTHLVFAASREDEFVDKIKGLTYAEIAAKGGGILNSAKKLAATSELDLL